MGKLSERPRSIRGPIGKGTEDLSHLSHQINGRDQALVTKAKWMDKIEDLEASLETLAHHGVL